MSSLYYVREKVIEKLFSHYYQQSAHVQKIVGFLPNNCVKDHFAVIDLPSEKSGISVLNQLFSSLGYLPQGRDYLNEKQNEFMWLAPVEALTKTAQEVSPQIVIADFHLDDLSPAIRDIIIKYTRQLSEFPWRYFHQLCGEVYQQSVLKRDAADKLIDLLCDYLHRRDSIPTQKDYFTVKEENELLAWVLAFGRGVNHFGFNIGLLNQYTDLAEFNQAITHQLKVTLNNRKGLIKGDHTKSIAQSSTEGENLRLPLSDGMITLSGPFIEFIWRAKRCENPVYWQDYFTGFIGQQADNVIESVYEKKIA